MSETSGGLPLMAQTQNSRYLTFNELAWAVNVLQTGVLDRDLTTPPGSPSEGDAYIVDGPATGAWAGHENDIAFFFGGIWNFLEPELGQGRGVWVVDEEVIVQYGLGSPTGWDIESGGGDVSDGDKGDITVSASGATWTIDNDAVSNAKAANMATATIKGRTTAGTGDPEDLTGAQAAAITQGDGLDADAAGFRGIPQNAQTGNYTLVAADAGKHIYHASGAGSGDTYTIPANSSVAFEVGTAVTFINLATDSVSIAITTDTMNLAGAGTTGTRTLAQYGIATAVKVTSTSWLISGTNLT